MPHERHHLAARLISSRALAPSPGCRMPRSRDGGDVDKESNIAEDTRTCSIQQHHHLLTSSRLTTRHQGAVVATSEMEAKLRRQKTQRR
uniref:Uncharacterized protein n=1 Tax=Arundo donax TaxID=35708 RepID=A0A0A8Z283_ARUDO